MSRSAFHVFFAVILLSMAGLAQTPARWGLSSDAQAKTLQPGETLNAQLKAEIDPGWHLYALEQPEGGPIATTIKVTEGKPFEIAGKIDSPKPAVKSDPNFLVDEKPLETKFFTDAVTFSVSLKTTAETRADVLSLDV